MAAETIREFLVALGFKVDEPTLKKFGDVITGATLKANIMAQAFVGMAKAVGESLLASTKDLNNLYFTSVRVGSSAGNLKALTLATQDFGVSAEEALQNVEAIAKAIRTDPGTENFINFLGVRTREANGEFRETADVITDIGKALADAPSEVAAQQFSDLLGITYKFRKAISDPAYAAAIEKYNALVATDAYNKAAREAAQLETQFRELAARWDGMRKEFAVKVFTPVIEELEKFEQWLSEHAPQISGYWHVMTVGLQAFIDAAHNELLSKGIDAPKMLQNFWKKDEGDREIWDWLVKRVKGQAKASLDRILDESGRRKEFEEALNDAQHPKPKTDLPRGVRNNNPGNLKYAGQPGAVRAGGGPDDRQFAAFRTPEEGLAAMARQLELDFSRGRTTIAQLIAKYAPPGENDTAGYTNDVARQLGRRGGDQLNLRSPSELATLMNAMIMHENLQNPYRPGQIQTAADQAAINLTQNNTININGVKDPQATRAAVGDALADYHRRMTRNLAPAAQ